MTSITCCEGTLNSICNFAQALRPGNRDGFDLYLLGEPTAVRIAHFILHNIMFHKDSIQRQLLYVHRIHASYLQHGPAPFDASQVTQDVSRILNEAKSNRDVLRRMIQDSENWAM